MLSVSIYNYTDYRVFLKDHFDLKKRNNPRFTFSVWAGQIGVANRAVLSNIVNGKRNPGPSVSAKISDYFSFSEQQKVYFQDLIALKKVEKRPELALAIMQKLKKNSPNKSIKFVDEAVYNTISSWHYITIREMILLPHFQEDEAWIQDKLAYKVSLYEIKKCLSDLLELDLVKRNESTGKLETTTTVLQSTTDIPIEGLKKYHSSMIEFAKDSIRNVDLDKRDITARTMNIPEASLPQLKEYIKEFRSKCEDLFAQNTSDSKTYQLNVQLFPLMNELFIEPERTNVIYQ